MRYNIYRMCWELATVLMGRFIIETRETAALLSQNRNEPSDADPLTMAVDVRVDFEYSEMEPLELDVRTRPTPSPIPDHGQPPIQEIEIESGRLSRPPSRDATLCDRSETELVELSPMTYRLREY